ncbi:hypothetical protein NXS98_06115 [Fontisphaera persica]|uniref:hypothetical protein n=1 Tax=Fontisphaera persica TaxID=2974023 RepID=UPI0024BF17D5|nr:hypothetical protein [Fontisphaera persica]WCJ60699.1 hypothetical protein NXS98_06115 [Fontisphaera persica]
MKIVVMDYGEPRGLIELAASERLCPKGNTDYRAVRLTCPPGLRPLDNCKLVPTLLLLILLSVSPSASGQSEASAPNAATKQAYVKLANAFALPLLEDPKQAMSKMDMAQVIAARKELFLDLRAIPGVGPELKEIIADVEKFSGQCIDDGQLLERLPKPPNEADRTFRLLYYGATLQLEAGEEFGKKVDQERADVQAVVRRMLQAQTQLEAATLLFPRIARTIAGPTSSRGEVLKVGIYESWGFTAPDLLKLENVSDQTLHNCTVVVGLRGMEGEVKQNVHFVPTWPSRSCLQAYYAGGDKVLGQVTGRQTVTGIQSVEVMLFCDELSLSPVKYTYAGSAREAYIGACLDKLFKPKARFRPFSKGLLFDDLPAVIVSFEGLQWLPPGTLSITVKSGDLSAARDQQFQTWVKGGEQTVVFKALSWVPSEWAVTFRFNDNKVTRTYRWKP